MRIPYEKIFPFTFLLITFQLISIHPSPAPVSFDLIDPAPTQTPHIDVSKNIEIFEYQNLGYPDLDFPSYPLQTPTLTQSCSPVNWVNYTDCCIDTWHQTECCAYNPAFRLCSTTPPQFFDEVKDGVPLYQD